MRGFSVTFVVLLSLMCSPLQADNSQKDKMKKCNETAKDRGLKGDERASFISTCMSVKDTVGSAADNVSPQDQAKADKAKTCEQEASQKGLKGKDRRSFMSTCTGVTK